MKSLEHWSGILLTHLHIIFSIVYIVYLSRINSIAFTTNLCSSIYPASPTPLPLATTLAPPRGHRRDTAYGVEGDMECTWHLFAFSNARVPNFSPHFQHITWPLGPKLVTQLA